MQGESLIWYTISEEKLPKFINNNKTTIIKVKSETLQIWEEKNYE